MDAFTTVFRAELGGEFARGAAAHEQQVAGVEVHQAARNGNTGGVADDDGIAGGEIPVHGGDAGRQQ